MAGFSFWSDMDPRPSSDMKLADKLMIGNVDSGDPDYTDVEDFRDFLNENHKRKDGYRWIRGEGNKADEWQVGDEGIGVGTLFPGYVVHFYVKTYPMTDPQQHLRILTSTPL